MIQLETNAVNQHTEHRLGGGQWLVHYSNIYTLIAVHRYDDPHEYFEGGIHDNPDAWCRHWPN